MDGDDRSDDMCVSDGEGAREDCGSGTDNEGNDNSDEENGLTVDDNGNNSDRGNGTDDEEKDNSDMDNSFKSSSSGSDSDDDGLNNTTVSLNATSICEVDVSCDNTDDSVNVIVRNPDDRVENSEQPVSHQRGRGGRRSRGRKWGGSNNRGGYNAHYQGDANAEQQENTDKNRNQTNNNFGNRGGKQFNRGSRNQGKCFDNSIGNQGKYTDNANDKKLQSAGAQSSQLFNDAPLKFTDGNTYIPNANYKKGDGRQAYSNHNYDQKNNPNWNGNNNNRKNVNNNYNNSNNSNNDKNAKNKNDNKKSEEHHNLLKYATNLINPFWRQRNKAEPMDSFVLKLHYRTSVCLFLIFFTIVQSNWFLRESIMCAQGHGNHNHIKVDEFHKLNFCLSYSYICELGTAIGDQCTRRYLLFYRWLYLCFLLIAPLYYIPRFVAKKVMNPRLKKLLVDLSHDEERYDDRTWEADTENMLSYVKSHRKKTSQYLWLLLCHLIALSIDVVVVIFLDFLLHNRFMELMYVAYPYRRELPYFTDYISQTFPPFANCTIHVNNLINNDRHENFGCYLYLMELYEKVFMVIWVWLALLMLITSVSLFLLFLLAIPPFNRMFLHIHMTSDSIKHTKRKVMRMCNLSDLYALHLMKRHRSEDQFVGFLSKFVHNYEESLQEVIIGHGKGKRNDEQKGNALDTLWNVGGGCRPYLSNQQSLRPTAPENTEGSQYPPLSFVRDPVGQDFRFRKPNPAGPKKRAPPPPLLGFSNQKFKNKLEVIPEVP